MIIRKGKSEDLSGILEIMNYYIEQTTSIFDLVPKTLQEMASWYEKFINDEYPLFVAEEDGEVMGYVYLSPYRPKAAYQKTVELSIYVAPGIQGRGLGHQLMKKILTEAKSRQYHTLLSFITSENKGSISFHEKYQFSFIGVLKEVGYKQKKWLDVSIYQKIM